MVVAFSPAARDMRSVLVSWSLDDPIHDSEPSLLEHCIHLTNNIGSNEPVEVLPAICKGTENTNVSQHQW